MIHTAKQMKDLVRNLSKKTGVEAHVLIRRFMMERLLERISLSKYSHCFILKGGMLVSSFVGIDLRGTMDIDTTIKGLPVTIDDMERIVREIMEIPVEDGVTFQIKRIGNIMDDDEYGGVRIAMEAYLDQSVTPLKLDISTGDVITPGEIRYAYPLMFEDRMITIMAYPLETVLAEKAETILSRATLNTRMRDYYDVYILVENCWDSIRTDSLRTAIRATAEKRGSAFLLNSAGQILAAIRDSKELQALWVNYQEKNEYAAKCDWDMAITAVQKIFALAHLSE